MVTKKTFNDPYAAVWSAKWRSPVAMLGIKSDGSHITEIAFLPENEKEALPADALSERAIYELKAYFRDPHFHFTLPILPHGTPFQQRVWAAMRRIPVGETRSYQDLAGEVASMARAVGGACGSNPIVIVIPCHRVVASHGIGGFSHATEGAPVHMKRALLSHEGVSRG